MSQKKHVINIGVWCYPHFNFFFSKKENRFYLPSPHLSPLIPNHRLSRFRIQIRLISSNPLPLFFFVIIISSKHFRLSSAYHLLLLSSSPSPLFPSYLHPCHCVMSSCHVTIISIYKPNTTDDG